MTELNGRDLELSAVDAEEDVELEDYEPPSIYIRGEFIGGDPTLTRMREVSISIPMREEDPVTDFGPIIATTLAEMARLGNLASYETQLRADGQTARIENGSSPQQITSGEA